MHFLYMNQLTLYLFPHFPFWTYKWQIFIKSFTQLYQLETIKVYIRKCDYGIRKEQAGSSVSCKDGIQNNTSQINLNSWLKCIIFKELIFKTFSIFSCIVCYKLNLWLTASKGAIPVNYISATDWQIAVRCDNVISIKLRKSNNVDFLNQIRYFSIK